MPAHARPWWRDDRQYVDSSPLAGLLAFRPDVVRAYVHRRQTQRGWGASDYLENRHSFALDSQDLTVPFGIVMRSIPVLGVDVDAKNGGTSTGTERALAALGLASVPTLAELSRSGSGYHLYYSLADVWSDDPQRPGYVRVADRIGFLGGVDIKAETLMYHYPHQRWNERGVAAAPPLLLRALSARSRRASAPPSPSSVEARVAALRGLARLSLPIEVGRRNTTLWGIAKDLYRGGFPEWETVIESAADGCGLSDSETSVLLHSSREAVNRERSS